MTVGDYRALVNQAKSLLSTQDFSSLRFILDDSNLSGALDMPTRNLLEDLISGDTSFFTAAFDVALEAVAGFAASASLLAALTDDASGGNTDGGNNGGGLTPVQTTFLEEVAELFEGSSGRDNIVARAEIGRILTGGGDDTVKGSTGDDNMKAGGGDDVVRGRVGDNKLNGGGGSDKIIGGGGGSDIARGGGGSDTLKGGGGYDFFSFRTGAGRDLILDFAQGDTIMITRGADEFSDLSITQQGANVLIEFANVDILIRTDNVDNFEANDFLFG